MEFVTGFLDMLLHVDKHLDILLQRYGFWTYLILFVIVFCETGLVVTPILPGDSLLFVTGTFAARGALDPHLAMFLLCLAAILGDTVNYWAGFWLGPRTLAGGSRWIKKEYLDRTHQFYARHGGKTIILARFVPIIRTFAPFVAGIGSMAYGRFIFYNIAGGIAWVAAFVYGGYFFGNLPLIKRHFSLVVLMIILISVMPGVIAFIRERRASS